MGALGSPQDTTRVLIHGQQEGADVGVTVHQQRVSGEYGRCAMPERIIEGAERDAPKLIAVGPVGEQAKVLEESIDIPTVAHGRAGGRTVGRTLDLLRAVPRRFAAPEYAAC